MSYNAPPCLLRDWVQPRIEEKSEFLRKLEERQAKAAEPASLMNVTPLRVREQSGGR